MTFSGTIHIDCPDIDGQGYSLIERLLKELAAEGWDTKDLLVLYRRI